MKRPLVWGHLHYRMLSIEVSSCIEKCIMLYIREIMTLNSLIVTVAFFCFGECL